MTNHKIKIYFSSSVVLTCLSLQPDWIILSLTHSTHSFTDSLTINHHCPTDGLVWSTNQSLTPVHARVANLGSTGLEQGGRETQGENIQTCFHDTICTRVGDGRTIWMFYFKHPPKKISEFDNSTFVIVVCQLNTESTWVPFNGSWISYEHIHLMPVSVFKFPLDLILMAQSLSSSCVIWPRQYFDANTFEMLTSERQSWIL